MSTAKLTSKGQITIPAAVRRHLGLSSGDRLEFVIEPGGRVSLAAKKKPFEAVIGILGRAGRKAAGPEEIDQAIGAAIAERQRRARRRR